MEAGSYFRSFALYFVVAFVVNAAVVWAWNLLVHGAGATDWGTAFFFGITLGVVLPLVEARGG